MPRSLQLPILAGGRLLTTPSASLESIGANDFSVVLNFYRDFDQMARFPGWTRFQPDTGTAVAGQYTFDAAETVLRMAELIRGDGTRVLVGASLTKIKYYDTATDAWVQIGSGYSASGLPWQAEVIAGYVIFNNTVDLPVWWQIGDAAVTPMYELREAGIASVGRITQYVGFLFVGDIIEVLPDHLPLWMNGYGSYTSTGNTAKGANFNVLIAEHRTNYQVTTGAGTITATLPAAGVANWGTYFLFEKVDAGAGTVVTSPVLTADALVLSANGDKALLFWNGVRWVAKVFALGSIPATVPYGIVPAAITDHISDEQAWSDKPGNPINWAPLLTGYVASAGTSVVLPFKPFNWTAKKTRVAVVRGGADQGTLGGQTLYPEGVLVTAFAAFAAASSGVVATIEVTTDTVITYPRLVDVTRWADVSTFVGKQRMGNGQRIVAMMELNGVLINYQEAAIFLTRWTAQAQAPFALRQKYSGNAVPAYGDCIAAVRNNFHVYPSIEKTFVMFDGLTDPTLHEMTENARDLFFDGLVPTDRCFAVANPTMQSIWFCRPSKVLAYRWRKDSEGVSEIDATVNAASFCRRPGGTVDWFVLAIGKYVYQFGLVNNTIETWLRDGAAATAKLTSGLNAFRDYLHEKTLLSYTPILSSPSPDTQISVQLRGTYNPSGTLTDLLVPVESLPTPAGDNLVSCMFQSNFFQDEIVLTDSRDVDLRISARLFEFDVVGGYAVTRTG